LAIDAGVPDGVRALAAVDAGGGSMMIAPGSAATPGTGAGTAAGSGAGTGSGSGLATSPHDLRTPTGHGPGSGSAGSAAIGPGSGAEEHPGDASAILASADKLYGQLNWSGAIEQYRRLIASKQLLRQAYLGLAQASFQNKDIDGTLEAATAALRYGAGVPARKLLGNAYFRKGDFQEARIHYERVLQDQPDDPEVRNSLDATLKKLGLPPRANH
ncbi:MAG TPA: tetratricopeptide repeat protein, partial [Kofleriaceae bacterium]|nr:tetratricopeptide repeat protein [Kofleriaceae bacterium]